MYVGDPWREIDMWILLGVGYVLRRSALDNGISTVRKDMADGVTGVCISRCWFLIVLIVVRGRGAGGRGFGSEVELRLR